MHTSGVEASSNPADVALGRHPARASRNRAGSRGAGARTLLTGQGDALPAPLDVGLVEHAAVLARRGLAQVTADGLVLHPVAAEWVRARSRDGLAEHGGWAAVAVRLLRAAAPDGPVDASRAAWRALLPHVIAATDPARALDAVADDVRCLLVSAGRYLETRGRTSAARALLDDARELGSGRSDPTTRP